VRYRKYIYTRVFLLSSISMNSSNAEASNAGDAEVIQVGLSVKGASSSFSHDFREFMYANKVVAAAAGFSIGSATKTMIEEIMSNVFLPMLLWLRAFLARRFPSSMLDFLNVPLSVVWSLVMYVTIVIMSFVILEYILNKEILGMRSRVSVKDSIDFATSKALAKIRGVFPTQKIVEADNASELADIIRGLKRIEREARENTSLVKIIQEEGRDMEEDGDEEEEEEEKEEKEA